ncbi:MAG: VWA domain-containing protein [Candidatus Omnitrophica bacterium]|nr:VWA domain-containing protein [Candidatus Omnitrophota bacterium]MBU1047678.1 VWA domain-containing protein [Candidatus Omnitrophota bacterium]MBU1631505.1 VWA domain-containing protein [Candidatus Omnitrophota bacterium]MBU1888592.1 VWA domain-containing protein [Candidatus Omnitrophota bacterium]
MKTKIFISVIVLFLCLVFGLKDVFADGLIIVDPPGGLHRPHPKPEALSVKYHRVQVNIENGIATTSIDQVFINNYDVDLEGTYIFPLPEDAAISNFTMYVDGKKMKGEILDKDKARQIYEDIVRRMKDPALLEYVGRNMFKMRVYPIPKRGEKRIELVYQETLKYDAGIYKYIYPLNTEKFSPKPLEEVTISANIKSKIPVKNVYSPSHEVDIKIEEFEATCGYEAEDVKPDKDFVLYYTVSEKDVGLNLLCYRTGSEDGYFMMLLSPGELKEKIASNKDIIFVLDTSGSMSGEKIKQAKEALKFCINSLSKGDKFNILSFATGVNKYKDSLVSVNNKSINEALDFIDNLSARGGTDINDALSSALAMITDSQKPKMIIFLTDGQPTVGVTDMKTILKNLEGSNTANARVFVFGVGNDVNTHLLDRISQTHRGLTEYVVPRENIEIKVSSFYRKISEPILANISLDFRKIKTKEIYPVTLPDIFKGTQLVLLGRYDGNGPTAIKLTGYLNGKKEQIIYEGNFPSENKENDFIPRIWAMRKIGYLMSEIRLRGDNKELIDEIVALSKEYGVMTQYTSFLVLEKDEDYKRWGIHSNEASKMIKEGKLSVDAMKQTTGARSVSSSMDISDLKGQLVVEAPRRATIKHIGAKTFYQQENGSWLDSKFSKGLSIKDIKYLSKEYFEILKENPELGKYFAIGEKVVVVFDGICYRITE